MFIGPYLSTCVSLKDHSGDVYVLHMQHVYVSKPMNYSCLVRALR